MATKSNSCEKCLTAIVSYHDEHGYMPTIRELCVITGLRSTSSVYSHINKLFQYGYIESEAPRESARAFRIGERAYEEGFAER